MIVTLENHKEIVCDGSQSIVTAGLSQKIYLPHSCLSGRCNTCKVMVLEGASIAEKPETGLSQEERDAGYILSCVRVPKTNMRLKTVDLGDAGFYPAATYPAKINSITRVSNDIIRLELRFPPKVDFRYLPGQYINILKDDFQRSYSIANITGESGVVLYVRYYEGGRFSQYLFHEATVNELLRIEGPFGTFVWQTSVHKKSIFLATGTGFAPIRSILGHLVDVIPELHIFYGGRRETDLVWIPETTPNLRYLYHVLSKPDDEQEWHEFKGYVHNIALMELQSFKDCVVYACGSEAMIKAASKLFIDNGLQPEDFHADAFLVTS